MNPPPVPPARPPSRWVVFPPKPEESAAIARTLQLSKLTAQCLLNRGFDDPGAIQDFLNPRLSRLADPFLLRDLDKAVKRLLQAKTRGERVLVFGDYDVDGISSVAILLGALEHFGIECGHYLPHREEEGYGLSQAAVESALLKLPANILVAVDCGSSSTGVVQDLQGRGIDVIILDHHQPANPAPGPLCFVNPHRESSPEAPFRELCSAGLAFKLAHGLVKKGREAGLPEALACDVRQWLDFAALAIVADLVPLTGENRILVSAGLQRLNTSPRPGLKALIEAAGISRGIGAYEIGFQLGPRLNAAGRLESATQALRLLLTRDPREAAKLASALNEQNLLRQEIERDILAQALARVRRTFDPASDWVIVEGEDSWHIGVVGIVAARVLREFYRPAIILGGGPPWRGSGRSITGFDLGLALEECHDVLIRHGGHAMAAGMTLDPPRLAELRRRLNEVARSRLKEEDLRPVLRLDSEASLLDLDAREVESLARLGPFGQGHPQVQLFARRVRLEGPARWMGARKQHARLFITDGAAPVEAVCWNTTEEALPKEGAVFDLAFIPELNTFRGVSRVQLRLLDWRASQPG